MPPQRLFGMHRRPPGIIHWEGGIDQPCILLAVSDVEGKEMLCRHQYGHILTVRRK